MSPRGQKLMANMITRASPNLYYVNFLDQPEIACRVDLSSPKTQQLEDKVLWAKILEQACLLRLPPDRFTDSPTSFGVDTLIGGSLDRASKRAMEMLTNKQVKQAVTKNSIIIPPDNLALSLEQMADVINRAVRITSRSQ